jgi:hypothetical protein
VDVSACRPFDCAQDRRGEWGWGREGDARSGAAGFFGRQCIVPRNNESGPRKPLDVGAAGASIVASRNGVANGMPVVPGHRREAQDPLSNEFGHENMVTLYDLMAILLPVCGLAFGAGLGSDHGFVWAVVGALAGGMVGLYLGRLPKVIMIRCERRKLAPLASAEIRTRLHDPSCWTPQFLLLELRSRGEDIGPELPCVFDLMESENQHFRMKGLAALLSAFPEVAKMARGYNPIHPVEKCRQKVVQLRMEAEQHAVPVQPARGQPG